MADLKVTHEQLLRGVSVEEQVVLATRSLLASTRAPGPANVDSLNAQFSRALAFYQFRPLLGTLDALVETGDIRLVRDSGLRTLLLSYRNDVEVALDIHRRSNDATVRIVERLGQSINLPSVFSASDGDGPFPTQWLTHFRDPGLQSDILLLSSGADTRLGSLRRVLSSLDSLVLRLEEPR